MFGKLINTKICKCPPPPVHCEKYINAQVVNRIIYKNLIKYLNQKIFCNKQVFLACLS